mmetsp:Transcript_233/g.858  ORF Transcript_233/g.858 Transcript_233/m.858 type:complete len:207 (-) Transcript_233:404-1024(-)
MWTLRQPFSAARWTAVAASSRGKVCEMKGVKSRPVARRSSAGRKGPQRDPTTASSSITKGAVLKSAPAAQVDLRTRVPRGLVSCLARSRPEGEPVASTTTSKAAALAGKASFAKATSTPAGDDPFAATRSILDWWRPKRVQSPRTRAIMRPNLPSPTTATLSFRLTTPCSRMRKAAARGSVKAAFSVVTVSGTTQRFLRGRQRYSA